MVIGGIGSPYGQSARIEGWAEEWDEIVAMGAWRSAITRPDVDVVSTFNHDLNMLLARTSSGTLTLDDPDDKGLVYEATINPDDPNAVGVHARVARGDVSGSSVWFRDEKDQWEEPGEDNDLEIPVRTILRAELYETGPVVFPAFPQTTAETSAASFRALGFNGPALTALDDSLTAAGITRYASRAAYALRFLADPEKDIRALFRQDPDLRGRVCDLESAADAAESAQPHLDLLNSERLFRIIKAGL
jgi:HK97 family phage prohead protease